MLLCFARRDAQPLLSVMIRGCSKNAWALHDATKTQQLDCVNVLAMLLTMASPCGLQVRRFARYVLGEGIEKRESNLAAEVAAATGQA